jgi:hypothetical protein
MIIINGIISIFNLELQKHLITILKSFNDKLQRSTGLSQFFIQTSDACRATENYCYY